MGAGRLGLLVALVAMLVFLGTVPAVLALPPAASSATTTPALAAPVNSALAPANHAPPPPLVCPNGYPAYVSLPGPVWPLDPNFNFQGPCHYIAEDEVHASFASGTNGSGERWSIPWTLPSQGSAGQQNIEDGLYVGMVVSGDPNSSFNQSYLEVQAIPSLNVSSDLVWDVKVAVLSFANMTYFSPVGCPPATAMNLSWNDTYFCEFDDLSGGNPIGMLNSVSAGTPLAVTFDGTKGGTAGMNVWVNETNASGSSAHTQLNVSRTNTYAFEPAYSTACASDCFLTWGQSYGLGLGIDICPLGGATFAACDSYNGTAYTTLPAATWGIPEYWNATGYSGDYRYLQPESASGVCDTNPPVGITTAGCFEYTGNGGDGFYPYFSLTGNGLAFGTTYSSSVSTYGGPYVQFLNTPGTQDLPALVTTGISDSSLAGYVAPLASVNVTFNVTDLGTITGATLAWSANGSAWTTEVLTGLGTSSARYYTPVIPSGPNGPVRYQVNATSAAGLAISSSVRTVLRGPLPSFQVGIGIVPGGCGTVSVGGRPYVNGSVATLGPGPVLINASGCYPFNFTSWQVSPALTVGSGGGLGATLVVRGNGNLTANFVYIRPTQHLSIFVTPSGCGDVLIDGNSYGEGNVANVLYGIGHTLSATVVCAGYAFGGWTPGANVTVLGDTLTVTNNGSLGATFVPSAQTDPVAFATNPNGCGGVGLGGAAYTTGESVNLAAGTYTLTPTPCSHFGFANFTTLGTGAAVAGTTLTVSGGNGTVVENNFHLTEVYVATAPGHCGGIVLDGTSYVNGTYVPVENHSAYTVTAFACAGHYLDAFTASGGLTLSGSLLSVNGSGTLLVVSLPGIPTIFVGFVTTPAKCGEINLGGTDYTNGAFVTLSPNVVLTIQALPCAAYGVVNWSVTGEISIVGGEAFLNGSGAITAIFGALVPILIETVPSTCGATLIDHVPYTDGSSAILINGRTYSILPSPCAHYELQDFESSPYVAILNSTLAPNGPSTITAVYVPIPYSVAATVLGEGCGNVVLDGAPVNSGEQFNLTAGNYTLSATPCPTSTFGGFVVSANLSFAVGHLFVNGSGTLSASFLPILPAVTLGGDPAAFVGGAALFYAEVAVPVSATGYTYDWSFGDGATNSTGANTTTHIYEQTGTFTVTVQVTDPFHHSANATLAVTVVAASTTNYAGPTDAALLALGIAAVALVAVVLLARWRRPPAAPSGEPSAAPDEPAPPPPLV
ncbi:MAG: PKD domain-containing protein [Thermoplasmata archaeon]|nr:PKD domain-containing protein [Thermoplasmata archaeon]